jgi:hypothetical protein
MSFSVYHNAADIPQSYLDALNGLTLTDEQKVELVNGLQAIVRHFHDMAYGVGQFSGPDHDAAAWRARQRAYFHAQDSCTSEELYQEGYDYWMGQYGAFYKKQHGKQAAEEKCARFAEQWAQRELESRKHWQRFKQDLHAFESSEAPDA